MIPRRLVRSAILAVAAAGVSTFAQAAPVDRAQLVSDPADGTPSPLEFASVRFGQVGRELVLSLHTRRSWRSAELGASGHGSLCLLLIHGSATGPGAHVCVVADRAGRPGLRVAPIDRAGHVGASHGFGAAVRRPTPRALSTRFLATDVGIPIGSLGWQLRSTWSGAGCATAQACTDILPETGLKHSRLVSVRPTGCDSGSTRYVENGARHGREIALSFDDGPATLTPRYLDVLERTHSHATFFQIGEQVAGHGALEARILREGNEIGDHTFTHADVSRGGSFAAGQISSTLRVIGRTSGYQPCLFRAPYGAVGSDLVRQARRQGLATIQWDVDPRDWSRPGSEAIYRRIVSSARAGSIILMHDGGGPRGQTLEALPRVIATLERRGFTLVSVSTLLGFPTVFGA